MLIPTDDRQFRFWEMRRSGTPNITIASLLGISRQAVSHGLLTVDKKVSSALEEMAKANRIEIGKMNVQHGILIGRSVPFQTRALIFVSMKHGLQVWYEHEGDCGTCQRYTECIELLWDYARELGISLQKTEDPTRMADELFSRIEEML